MSLTDTIYDPDWQYATKRNRKLIDLFNKKVRPTYCMPQDICIAVKDLQWGMVGDQIALLVKYYVHKDTWVQVEYRLKA